VRVQIGVITTYDDVPREVAEKARRLARKLVELGCIVITGGDGGVMKIIAEEVQRAGGIAVGILPIEAEEWSEEHPWHNPYNTVEIRTGMTYTARSAIVVRSSDAIILVAGGAGSLTELAMAYNTGIPVVVLTGTGLLADELRKRFPEGYLDHRRLVKLTYATTPEEAAEKAYELALERRRRG